jgi:coenzyme F420-0:L-glutamate ligase/coenzyme F420-1:gamma-L-glutamate ligase
VNSAFVPPPRLEVIALEGIPEVGPAADLAELLALACERGGGGLSADDVLVVAQKIISKSEGRRLRLRDVVPSARARELAAATGKDPRLVEVVLAESVRVLRVGPEVIIVEDRRGLVLANAGVDQSNVGTAEGPDAEVLLLPIDPDASATRLRDALEARTGVTVAVVISDSLGRAWRLGTVGHAIGAAGLPALIDWRGRRDRQDRSLRHTETALADSLAAAAVLVMGEAAEGRPAAVVRGLKGLCDLERPGAPRGASALQRLPEKDLFR